MNRSAVFLGASLFTLCASCAFAGGPAALSARGASVLMRDGAKTLYSQNSNDAQISISSENLTSGSSSAYNDQGADDFVVPKGQIWTVTEVDVSGQYVQSSGPANSENVFFYKDKKGMPGKPVRNGTFLNLDGAGGPDFAIGLPGGGLKLKPGRYWISVVANIDFQSEGSWNWEVSSKQHGDQAMWRNPPGGFDSCLTWCTIESIGSTGPDFMFGLKGFPKFRH